MSDVYLGFGLALALALVFPGLIITWWLLFPGLTGRAEERLVHNPILTFATGSFLTLTVTIIVIILVNVPLPGANFLAAALVVVALAFAAVGAAGLTGKMAARLRQRAAPGLSEAASFLRAVVALELAAAFPIVGWFLFVPLCIVICLGAACLALIGGAAGEPVREPTVISPAVGAADVA